MGEEQIKREDSRKVIRCLSYTDRLHHCIVEKRIQKLGIHRSWHMMLMHLAGNRNVPSQKELAEEFHISTAAVANTLKNLEKHGYISRAADADDTRRNIISITPKGLDIVESSRKLFDSVDSAMLSGVTVEQLDTFLEVLGIFQKNLHRLEETEDGVQNSNQEDINQ